MAEQQQNSQKNHLKGPLSLDHWLYGLIIDLELHKILIMIGMGEGSLLFLSVFSQEIPELVIVFHVFFFSSFNFSLTELACFTF